MSDEMVYPEDEPTLDVNVPDRWNIIHPEDESIPPLLHFYKGKNIIASIPLEEGVVKDLAKALSKYEARDNRTVLQKAKDYWKTHKIFGTLAALGILLGLFFTISSAFVVK